MGVLLFSARKWNVWKKAAAPATSKDHEVAGAACFGKLAEAAYSAGRYVVCQITFEDGVAHCAI